MTLKALYDVQAPAKLNLFLHVLGRRADGYHLLQSLFVLIDWADVLQLELRADGVVRRQDIGAALPADDLCLRAARALQSAGGVTLGADIHIDKQVPWGAGMGGGSSDAASVLLALNRLWGLHWPRAKLAEIGMRLGADVPFFIGGDNAFVEGIGEILTPLKLPEPQARYAVIKPPTAIDTGSIFGHPKLVCGSHAAIVAGSPEEAGLGGFAGLLPGWMQGVGTNDLQPAAEDQCAEVAQAARWLDARFGNSRMTGSGSAVFSRAGSSEPPFASAAPVAVAPGQAVEGLPHGWVGRMCRGLARHPLAGWAD